MIREIDPDRPAPCHDAPVERLGRRGTGDERAHLAGARSHPGRFRSRHRSGVPRLRARRPRSRGDRHEAHAACDRHSAPVTVRPVDPPHPQRPPREWGPAGCARSQGTHPPPKLRAPSQQELRAPSRRRSPSARDGYRNRSRRERPGATGIRGACGTSSSRWTQDMEGTIRGAAPRRGVHEKDVVLSISRELKKAIDAREGMRAVLTRKGDYYVGLRRAHGARSAGAGRPLRLGARRCVPQQERARRLRVRDLAARSEQRGGALARGAGKLRRTWPVAYPSTKWTRGWRRCCSTCPRPHPCARAGKSAAACCRSWAGLAGSTSVGWSAPDSWFSRRRTFLPYSWRPGSSRIRVTSADSWTRRSGRAIARAIAEGIAGYFEVNPPAGTLLAERRHVIARGDTLSDIAKRYRVSLAALRSENRLQGGPDPRRSRPENPRRLAPLTRRSRCRLRPGTLLRDTGRCSGPVRPPTELPRSRPGCRLAAPSGPCRADPAAGSESWPGTPTAGREGPPAIQWTGPLVNSRQCRAGWSRPWTTRSRLFSRSLPQTYQGVPSPSARPPMPSPWRCPMV